MSGSTGGVCVGTSGFMPQGLVDVIKCEIRGLERESRTRRFSVEYFARDGILIEARFRTREMLTIVPLTS